MAILILVFILLMAFLAIALLLVIFFIIISQLKFDIKCIFSATKLVIPKEKCKQLGILPDCRQWERNIFFQSNQSINEIQTVILV
mgnify:CR=1 FL=1